MPRVAFHVRRLYYMTQFWPVARALARRGAECRFVAFEDGRTPARVFTKAFEALGDSLHMHASEDDTLATYRRTEPDWLVLGTAYPHRQRLPKRSRTAMLYHGVGMKRSMYEPPLISTTVRFTEGPHHTAELRRRFPKARLVEVGCAKLDPLFWDGPERPVFDLAAAGLDPGKKTILFAPTHSASCFANMSDRFPHDFRDYNLIVKAHENSHTSSQRQAHRRKMDRWAAAPNVYVAAAHEFNPVPFMAVADLTISDASSVLFEFAATQRPVVLCDFVQTRWLRRAFSRTQGRLEPTMHRFADIGAHASRYRDLARVVEDELANPERHAARRRECTAQLLGPTDGKASDRIAHHLLATGAG